MPFSRVRSYMQYDLGLFLSCMPCVQAPICDRGDVVMSTSGAGLGIVTGAPYSDSLVSDAVQS